MPLTRNGLLGMDEKNLMSRKDNKRAELRKTEDDDWHYI